MTTEESRGVAKANVVVSLFSCKEPNSSHNSLSRSDRASGCQW